MKEIVPICEFTNGNRGVCWIKSLSLQKVIGGLRVVGGSGGGCGWMDKRLKKKTYDEIATFFHLFVQEAQISLLNLQERLSSNQETPTKQSRNQERTLL